MYYMGKASSEAVRLRYIYSDVKIHFKDKSSLVSDTSCYYIGKTSKYIFFYDSEQKHARVYPMSEVDRMVF